MTRRFIVTFLLGISVLSAACSAPPGHESETDTSPVSAAATDSFDHLPAVRQYVADRQLYYEMMQQALDLHDQGKIQEAHRAASRVVFLFPEDPAARWLAQRTEEGKSIPAGASITFRNLSDRRIKKITLDYRRGPVMGNQGREELVVEDLEPGESREIYTDHLPQSTVRLRVQTFYHDSNARSISSSRMGGSDFGFVPIVTVGQDGVGSAGLDRILR